MAMNIPGIEEVLEATFGLPRGFLAAVGGEDAAVVALAVQRGELEPYTLEPKEVGDG